MDDRYDLTPLYQGFDDVAFLEDLKELESLLGDYKTYVDEASQSYDDFETKLKALIDYDEKITVLARKLSAFIALTRSVDTTNETAARYQAQLMKLFSDSTVASTKANKYIGQAPNLEAIAQKETFAPFAFYLKEIQAYTKYLLSDEEEYLISQLRQSGSNEWANLQSLLTSKVDVEITVHGEKRVITASQLSGYFQSPDPEERKAAFEGMMKAFETIEDGVASALSGIKGEVLTVSKRRGFASPLDEALHKSRMSRETLEAMLETIRKYLPVFHRYLRRKAKLLGHEGGLPQYDLTAPIGKIERTFTIEEARDFIVENFNTFSPALGDLVKRAFDERWIDFYPRKGKRGGAFCMNIHPIKQSRIMTNFNGKLGDVITIAHELGHAYHGEQIFKEHILNASYPMPLAETASTFCETIVMNAAIEQSEGEERVALIESMLQDQTAVIVDILARFIFETNVFKVRESHPITAKEAKALMREAIIEAYGDGLDHRYLNEYAWLNKPHYYNAGLSFYNFPYAFGLLFAKGLYAQYLKQKTGFVERYNALLRATGKMPVEEVARLADIDVTKKDFWRDSLELIKSSIDEFLRLTE